MEDSVSINTDSNGFNFGSPIQLFKVSEHGKFILDEKALSSILLHESVRDTPVVVISITGDFREGKSFMLNFLLRKLKSVENDWLGDYNQPLKGFSWRPGSERDTTGIVLWSHPFNVKLKNGKNVALILMDTQGAFDKASTIRENATVFALSTLTSSIQVYNLMRNIKENYLQQLEYFTEYGKLVVEETQEIPFQKLVFLVRDWSCPYDYKFGSVGGQELLKTTLSIDYNTPLEIQKVRKNLKSCFNKIECFLMPHPGSKVHSSRDFEGKLSDIEPEFIDYMKLFVSDLIHPKNLLVKKIYGQEMTGNGLFDYFRLFSDIFSSGKLPKLEPLLEATARQNNLSAMKEAKDSYTKAMENLCGRNQTFIEVENLEFSHNLYREKAIEQFDKIIKMGGLQYSKSYRNQLIVEIEEAFQFFEAHNKSKKTWIHTIFSSSKSLGSYVILPLLASLIFFAGIKAGVAAVVVASAITAVIKIVWEVKKFFWTSFRSYRSL